MTESSVLSVVELAACISSSVHRQLHHWWEPPWLVSHRVYIPWILSTLPFLLLEKIFIIGYKVQLCIGKKLILIKSGLFLSLFIPFPCFSLSSSLSALFTYDVRDTWSSPAFPQVFYYSTHETVLLYAISKYMHLSGRERFKLQIAETTRPWIPVGPTGTYVVFCLLLVS